MTSSYWQQASELSENPQINEAVGALVADATSDNAIGLIATILETLASQQEPPVAFQEMYEDRNDWMYCSKLRYVMIMRHPDWKIPVRALVPSVLKPTQNSEDQAPQG